MKKKIIIYGSCYYGIVCRELVGRPVHFNTVRSMPVVYRYRLAIAVNSNVFNITGEDEVPAFDIQNSGFIQ